MLRILRILQTQRQIKQINQFFIKRWKLEYCRRCCFPTNYWGIFMYRSHDRWMMCLISYTYISKPLQRFLFAIKSCINRFFVRTWYEDFCFPPMDKYMAQRINLVRYNKWKEGFLYSLFPKSSFLRVSFLSWLWWKEN